jgi:hypothetical protein
VLYRSYFPSLPMETTRWYVGPSDRLNDCGMDNDDDDLQSKEIAAPLGYAPTALGYNAGLDDNHRYSRHAGWFDGDIGMFSHITVSAGDGSASSDSGH